MPPCIFIPRILAYDLDQSAEGNGANLSLEYYSKVCHFDFPTLQLLGNEMKVSLNPFFCLTKVSDMPKKPADIEELGNDGCERYIVNGLFGNEDFSSIVRVVLKTKSKVAIAILDYVIAWRVSKPSPDIFKEERKLN